MPESHLNLVEDLDRFRTHFERRVGPAVAALINSSIGEMSGLEDRVRKAGEAFPKTSSLLDRDGKKFNLSKTLKSQKAVVFFYRGNWCPYCRLTLRAFQDTYPHFRAAGAELVAITPEVPEFVGQAVEQHDITYPVLSDTNAKLIKSLRLDYRLSEKMRALFESDGPVLPIRNGSEDWTLPLTAAFIVEPPGIIKERFVSPDYTKRTELAAALNAVEKDFR
jgi:peroxiredoxin